MSNGTLKEITRSNPIYQICPICGHTGWCATIEAEDGNLLIVCKRDIMKADVNGFTYITDGKKEGNSVFVFGDRAMVQDPNWKPTPPTPSKKKDEVPRFPDVKLDLIYRDMLKMLTLEDHHREYLYKEGYNDDMIRDYHIKSFPVSDGDRYKNKIQTRNPYRGELAKKLFEKHGDLTGLPGACLKERKGQYFWTFGGPSGILFPAANKNGEIVGFQIRRDQIKEGEAKYKWLSSSGDFYKNGCSPGNRVAFVRPNVLGDTFACYITEGIKKAHKGAQKLGGLFISIQGVNSWNELLEPDENGKNMVAYLEEKYGTKLFIIALDNDKYHNAKVMDSQKRIVENLKKEGFMLGLAEWDQYMGKGIDDMLNNGYFPMYHPV